MADSLTPDLTQASSIELSHPNSVLFYGVLPDLTPVAVPGSELTMRTGLPSGVLVKKSPTQGFPADTTWYEVAIDTVVYDTDVWWNVLSANILMVPDDTFDQANMWYWVQWDNQQPGIRQLEMTYSTVSSNTHGYAYPVTGTGSVSNTHAYKMDKRPTETHHNVGATHYGPPFSISSGDQFVLSALGTVVTTINITEIWWGITPTRFTI